MGKKVDFLEGIRTLSVMAVMLHHFFFAFMPALITGNVDQSHTVFHIETFIARSPLNIFYNGNFAFFLLFVVSGFVLSYKFFKTKSIEVVQQSAAKRYFRLVVPVFVSVFIAYWFMKLNLFANMPVSVITHSYNWLNKSWNFVPNFFAMLYEGLVGTFFFGTAKYNSVLWMMRYEFFGSFLVFGFLALFGKVKARYLLYVVLSLVFLQTFYLSFILGIILADLYVHDHPLLRNIPTPVLAVLAIVGVFFASYPIAMKTADTMYAMLRLPFLKSYVSFYHSIGAVMLLLVIFNVTWVKNFLSLKPFVTFAKLAFSLYLLHQIVLFSVTCYSFLFFEDKLSYFQNIAVSGALSLVVLLVAAVVMYNIVEKNGQKMTQYIYSKLFS
ncbi:MAG: acyltransferase [Patescibacteria group bacterium]|jgi:peptidoglycan/LPS O-acetylase OafA/YrhL